MSSELPVYRPRCMFLSCKSMLVYGEDFESDPEYQAGATEFWEFGPGGVLAAMARRTDKTWIVKSFAEFSELSA